MTDLSDLEKMVLDMLLAGDHPTLLALREQADKARITSREYTGVGFFCQFDVPPDLRALPGEADFHVGDVNATMDGLQFGAGFVLLIRSGRLFMLEGYTYEEPWPEVIRNLRLTYQCEPRELPPL